VLVEGDGSEIQLVDVKSYGHKASCLHVGPGGLADTLNCDFSAPELNGVEVRGAPRALPCSLSLLLICSAAWRLAGGELGSGRCLSGSPVLR
jgi:hypothetical protein